MFLPLICFSWRWRENFQGSLLKNIVNHSFLFLANCHRGVGGSEADSPDVGSVGHGGGGGGEREKYARIPDPENYFVTFTKLFLLWTITRFLSCWVRRLLISFTKIGSFWGNAKEAHKKKKPSFCTNPHHLGWCSCKLMLTHKREDRERREGENCVNLVCFSINFSHFFVGETSITYDKQLQCIYWSHYVRIINHQALKKKVAIQAWIEKILSMLVGTNRQMRFLNLVVFTKSCSLRSKQQLVSDLYRILTRLRLELEMF